MNYFEIFTALIVMLAIFSVINEKFLHFPFAIGITITSITVSILCVILERTGLVPLEHERIDFLSSEFFSQFVLQYVLGFLLFAGALHVSLKELKKEKVLLFTFSTISVLAYAVIYGTVFYFILNALGFKFDFWFALLVGVILSPTDPIAVMSILNNCFVPDKLRVLISGESLFNDGISYSLFIIVSAIVLGKMTLDPGTIATVLFKEIIVSIFAGFILGIVSLYFVRRTKDSVIAVIESLAVITLSFTLAERFHFSGPLAVIIIGLLYSKYLHGSEFLKSGDNSFYDFWKVLDQILNGLLFLIIGLELSTLQFTTTVVILSIGAIGLNLIVRWISIIGPTVLYHYKNKLLYGKLKLSLLLTWGSLRGGLSLALIMSIGYFEGVRTIISTIYFVILFSIIVQGLSIKPILLNHDFSSFDEL